MILDLDIAPWPIGADELPLLRQPCRICEQPAGRWCVNRDGTLRALLHHSGRAVKI